MNTRTNQNRVNLKINEMNNRMPNSFDTYLYKNFKTKLTEIVALDDHTISLRGKKVDLNKYRGVKLFGCKTAIDIYPLIMYNIYNNVVSISDLFITKGFINIEREMGINKGESVCDAVLRFLSIQKENGRHAIGVKTEFANRYPVIKCLPIRVSSFETNSEDAGGDYGRLLAFMMPELTNYNYAKAARFILNIDRACLAIDNKSIKNVSIKHLKDKKPEVYKYIDDLGTAIELITGMWAKEILKEIVSKEEVEKFEIAFKLTEKEALKKFNSCFHKGSPYKKYFLGEINSYELFNLVTKNYKTRLSDIQLQVLGQYFNIDVKKALRVENSNLFLIGMASTYTTTALFNLIGACNIDFSNCPVEVSEKLIQSRTYTDTLSEIESLKRDIENKDKSHTRDLQNIENLKNENRELKNKLKELSRDSSGELKRKFEKAREDLEAERIKVAEGLANYNELDNKYSDKIKECSDALKENKRLEAKLAKYIEYFGELESENNENSDGGSDSDGNTDKGYDVAKDTPLAKKVEYLSMFNILLCGGMSDLRKSFRDNFKLDVLQADKENWADADKKFDICVIVAIRCEHKLVFKCKSRSESLGVPLMYVKNYNTTIILDDIYNRLYSIYGEI